jgi:hypothetical protein
MQQKLRLIKAFFIVLLFLLVSITIISLIIPSRVAITKSAETLAKPSIIMDTLKQLESWQRWYPVLEAYKQEISEVRSNANTISWKHNGKLSSIEMIEQQANAIRFLYKSAGNPDVENMITCFGIDNKPNSSNVEWTAVTILNWYPWEKFSGLFIEKVTGASYEYGLANLNKLMNKTSLVN